MVHIGGGACTLPRYVEATRPRSRQLVFELDPGVVALAREHLGLRASPRLRIKVGDAADLIRARPERSADLVIGDAFDGPDVPAQLSGAAFLAEVRRVLRPSGVYALNVIDIPPLDAVHAHDAVARAAFPHVAWVAPAGRPARPRARERGAARVGRRVASGCLAPRGRPRPCRGSRSSSAPETNCAGWGGGGTNGVARRVVARRAIECRLCQPTVVKPDARASDGALPLVAHASDDLYGHRTTNSTLGA